MRKYFCIVVILSFFVAEYTISETVPYPTATSEEITFDGYWWSTLNEWQKLGYVQGYLDSTNSNYPMIIYLLAYQRYTDSEKEKSFYENKYLKWVPFDKSFGYYIERIDGYFQTTKDLKKETTSIMRDLMNPVPQ